MTDKELCTLAIKAMNNSYSPYSDYRVGAALMTEAGMVYTGCNIENSAFSPTCCAERTAFFTLSRKTPLSSSLSAYSSG